MEQLAVESYWHGVPLFPMDDEGRWATSRSLNFVCVMPKHSMVVREVRTKEEHTPIKYRCFVEGRKEPLPYNYGLLPRTFLGAAEQVLGLGGGDNGSVECVEVSSTNEKTAKQLH